MRNIIEYLEIIGPLKCLQDLHEKNPEQLKAIIEVVGAIRDLVAMNEFPKNASTTPVQVSGLHEVFGHLNPPSKP